MTTTYLTSTAITYSPDGQYPYHVKAMLIPHEAIRREMIRLKLAIDTLNPLQQPWKIAFLYEWIHEFFLPTMQQCYDICEKELLPHYCKLAGAEFPANFAKDNKVLVMNIQKLGELIHELHVAFRTYNYQETWVETMVQELKRLYFDLYDKAMDHFDQEERFWPEHFDRVGVKTYVKLESRFVKDGMIIGKKQFELFLASMLTSMGIEMGKHRRSKEYQTKIDLGWASKDLQEEFLTTIPSFPTRTYSLPKWMNHYQYYLQLIQAIIEVNITPLELGNNQANILYYICSKYPAIKQHKKLLTSSSSSSSIFGFVSCFS